MVSNDLEVYFIDLSFTNPTCKTSITLGSNSKPYAAANSREKDKIRKYNKYLKAEAHSLFVPFIGETTGRLTTTTFKYIQKLCKLDKFDLELSENIKWERLKFMEELNIRLARTNANVMSRSRAMGYAKGIY